MEFKKGDMVVCINNVDFNTGINKLELNKTYIIEHCGYSFVYLENLIHPSYHPDCFKLLSEFRKEKLKQLRNAV
jgi:hypothetical protein